MNRTRTGQPFPFSLCFFVTDKTSPVPQNIFHVAEENKCFSHLRRVEVVPGLSPHTTGSSLPSFHHLEKQEAPQDPTFLFNSTIVYSKHGKPSAFTRAVVQTRDLWQITRVLLLSAPKVCGCTIIYTCIYLSLGIYMYRLIFLDQIKTSNNICLVSWSTRW